MVMYLMLVHIIVSQKRDHYAVAKCLFLVAHNFKVVIGTGLKPDMVILQSLFYHMW